MKSPYTAHPLVTGFLVSLALLQSPANAVELPKVQFVNGDVHVLRPNGVTIPIKKGDVIHPGEKLITGNVGVAQIRATDQGVVALRKNSEIEFKPVADKFDVALNRGQVRTVTALGANLAGQMTVQTPQSNVSVKNGDSLTGIQTDSKGAASTFSQSLSGEVDVHDQSGNKLQMTPGQVVQSLADAAPVAVIGATVFNPAPALPGTGAAPGSPGEATKLARTENVPAPPALNNPASGPGSNNLAGALSDAAINLGRLPGAGVTLAVEQTQIPPIRVVPVSISIAGADSSVNDGLAQNTLLQAGNSGIPNDKTLTFTTQTGLPPTSIIVLTQKQTTLDSTIVNIAVLPKGSVFVSTPTATGGRTKVDEIALTARPDPQPTIAQPTIAQPTIAQPTIAQLGAAFQSSIVQTFVTALPASPAVLSPAGITAIQTPITPTVQIPTTTPNIVVLNPSVKLATPANGFNINLVRIGR